MTGRRSESEWALAGCKAFIAAPRHRTSGKDLHDRVFLHADDWHQDAGFGVLELIMTASVHGGVGVVEGNGGMKRPGLS